MKNKVLAILASLATIVAALAATSACWWWMYQPEEPESLKKF